MRRPLVNWVALALAVHLSVTNHAGRVLSGPLGVVTNGTFEIGSRKLPLAVLPPSEQLRVRRLAGEDVRTPWARKVDADLDYELKRIDARLAEGELTPAAAEARRRDARAAAAFRRTRAPSVPAPAQERQNRP